MSKIFKGDLRTFLSVRTRQNRIRGIESGSMRQNRDRSTTPSSTNASTCGFLTRKWQRAQGFRNLPHTTDGRFRKCGENQRSADQTPVLCFRDMRFCCRKSGCARRFSIFPRTSGKRGPSSCFLAKIRLPRQHPVVAKTSKGRCRKPDNDPSLSPPHVESAATASLKASYRNVKQPDKATIGNAAVRHQFQSK